MYINQSYSPMNYDNQNVSAPGIFYSNYNVESVPQQIEQRIMIPQGLGSPQQMANNPQVLQYYPWNQQASQPMGQPNWPMNNSYQSVGQPNWSMNQPYQPVGQPNWPMNNPYQPMGQPNWPMNQPYQPVGQPNWSITNR